MNIHPFFIAQCSNDFLTDGKRKNNVYFIENAIITGYSIVS